MRPVSKQVRATPKREEEISYNVTSAMSKKKKGYRELHNNNNKTKIPSILARYVSPAFLINKKGTKERDIHSSLQLPMVVLIYSLFFCLSPVDAHVRPRRVFYAFIWANNRTDWSLVLKGDNDNKKENRQLKESSQLSREFPFSGMGGEGGVTGRSDGNHEVGRKVTDASDERTLCFVTSRINCSSSSSASPRNLYRTRN